MPISGRVKLLQKAYRLFNHRRVDDLLAMMTEDIEWPDVAHGAVLRGKDAIRSYWAGQFAVANPQVTPTEFIDADDDVVAVVDQETLDLEEQPLIPRSVIFHRYTFEGDLVRRMVVFTDRAAAIPA